MLVENSLPSSLTNWFFMGAVSCSPNGNFHPWCEYFLPLQLSGELRFSSCGVRSPRYSRSWDWRIASAQEFEASWGKSYIYNGKISLKDLVELNDMSNLKHVSLDRIQCELHNLTIWQVHLPKMSNFNLTKPLNQDTIQKIQYSDLSTS
jgi:hypothetical protein